MWQDTIRVMRSRKYCVRRDGVVSAVVSISFFEILLGYQGFGHKVVFFKFPLLADAGRIGERYWVACW